MMALSKWIIGARKSFQLKKEASFTKLMRTVNKFYNVTISKSVVRSIHDLREDRFKDIHALLVDIHALLVDIPGWVASTADR